VFPLATAFAWTVWTPGSTESDRGNESENWPLSSAVARATAEFSNMRLTTSAGANPVPDTVMLAPGTAVAGETETEAANASEAVKLKTTKRKRHTRPEDIIAPWSGEPLLNSF
jgi:hypothetical protein